MTTIERPNTAIATQQPGDRMTLAQVSEITGYQLAEIALIRATVAKDAATLPDLALFLHGARRLGLDPLNRQIYWIVRQGKGGIQVGIDGFRVVAARSKEYAGSEPAIFRGVVEVDDGNKRIEVPEMASVVVWRIVQGRKCAFTGEARWNEFYPGPGAQGFMWRKMPYNQLGKCAEAQALRKGFPAEMSGMPPAPVDDGDLPHVEVSEVDRPQRAALTAADYSRIHGSDDAGTAFADMPRTAPQDASAAETTGMITSKRHAAWSAYTAAYALAEGEGLDVPALELPLAEDVLRSSTASLVELVEQKRAAAGQLAL